MLRYALLISAVALSAMGVFAKRGWIDYRRMVRQNSEMAAKVADAVEQHALIERQIASLQSDTQQQEVLVRQTLGYVRPSETVIEFR